MLKHVAHIRPGNQQIMSYSLAQNNPSLSSFNKVFQTEEESATASSGIERTKRLINEKFQKMVDWGQFTSQALQ